MIAETALKGLRKLIVMKKSIFFNMIQFIVQYCFKGQIWMWFGT